MNYSYRRMDVNVNWCHSVVTAWVRGQHIWAALDTSCSQSLIRADIVLQEHLKGSIPIRLTCVHGEAAHCERKLMPIRVMEVRGELRMGIAPKHACEVVLGCDWPPIYQVINQVRKAEMECQ